MTRQIQFEDESLANKRLGWTRSTSQQPVGLNNRIRKFSTDIIESARRKSYIDSVCIEENVDGGYAWIILIVVFMINASTFGTARAYGLIFEYSARQDKLSRSEAALPFTIMGAVENMAGPLTGYLLVRTGSWRVMVFAGSCLVTLSHLLAAYFGSKLGQIMTVGLMCGIGQSFISISSFQINNAYFVRYRSSAFGIALTGAAVGAIYISPLCQFVLDKHSKELCFLALGLLLFPNIALALLLKLKDLTPHHLSTSDDHDDDDDDDDCGRNNVELPLSKRKFSISEAALAAIAADSTVAAQIPTSIIRRHSEKPTVFTLSSQLVHKANGLIKTQITAIENEDVDGSDSFWNKINQVLATPLFHLIWPTQLLFCWLNFVFGMIITDFGKDRGLSETQNSRLIIIWAAGQLFGRLCLGSLIDLRILSYKSFTTLCFASISLTTFVLNNFGQAKVEQQQQEVLYLGSNLIYLLVFILSMFISTLYILFNGLVVKYMDKSVAPLSIGISSFTGSFFLLPRALVIGHYRDTFGNYDSMLTMFTCVTLIAALVWLFVPTLCVYLSKGVEGCNSVANCNSSRSRSVSKDDHYDYAKRYNSVPNTSAVQINDFLSSNYNRPADTRISSSGKKTDVERIATIEEEEPV